MTIDTVLVVAGAAILALGLPSAIIKRLWLSVPLLAVAVGVLLGPEVLRVLDPASLGRERKVLEELARVTLAVSLVGLGLQVTRRDLRELWRRATSLLTIGMLGMWLLTSLGAHLLLDLPAWLALLLGAILTPTDPVVASTLVNGRMAEANLPRSLRRSLQLESGANDGLAVAFVLVPAMVLGTSDGAAAIAEHVVKQVVIAVVAGAAIGFVAAKLVDGAEDHSAASVAFFLVSAFALALLTLGGVAAAGGTGVLGAFVAGVTFSALLEEEHAETLEEVQSGLEQLLLVPVFLLFGAMLPWEGWHGLGLAGVAFALWTLLVRRPPAAALALAVTSTERRDRRFLAWYGPVGVAAIYYVTFVEQYALEQYERLFSAATLAIAVSIVAFSVSATPGVRLRGGRSPFMPLRHPLTQGVEEQP